MITFTRRIASKLKHGLFPKPALRAWRKACRQSTHVERYCPGTIRLMGYRLQYADLVTLCPQWHDLFVRQHLAFKASGTAPRILDCGANIGLATLYFKSLYPGARITSYEADPDICEMLRENLRNNGASDVEVIPAAVWTADGDVSFYCEGADSGTIEQFASGVQGTMQHVPSIRLRDVLLQENIDLLKLDIESAEVAVLDDCRDALQNTSAIVMDLHEFDRDRRTTTAVLELLGEAGFRYSLDSLDPLPWKGTAGDQTPFPGTAECWAVLVRAWRA